MIAYQLTISPASLFVHPEIVKKHFLVFIRKEVQQRQSLVNQLRLDKELLEEQLTEISNKTILQNHELRELEQKYGELIAQIR